MWTERWWSVCWRICFIFLCFSTNGTVINMSKLVKKQTHMLQNGDVIYFVYRKSEPEQSELLINWIYIFKKRKRWQRYLPPRHCLCIPFDPNGAASVPGRLWWAGSWSSLWLLSCLPAHVVASVWTEDTQRSDCCLASVSPSEMLLSVEPVMLTKAPSDLSQDDPQPSTSSSRFCIGIQTVHDPGAPGRFCFFVSLLGNSLTALWRLTRSKQTFEWLDRSPLQLTRPRRVYWIYYLKSSLTCLFSLCSGPVSDAAPVQEKDDMEPEYKRRKTDDGEKSWDII